MLGEIVRIRFLVLFLDVKKRLFCVFVVIVKCGIKLVLWGCGGLIFCWLFVFVVMECVCIGVWFVSVDCFVWIFLIVCIFGWGFVLIGFFFFWVKEGNDCNRYSVVVVVVVENLSVIELVFVFIISKSI